jgi:hypothetical protein
MDSKCTVLTMFFNLKELKDTTSATRPLDFYLEKGRPTLEINNPMIIFCDKKTRPLIEALRSELSSAPTEYIERDINDYDYYKLNWSVIRENRTGAKHYVDSRNTSSYFLMGMFKVNALKIALDKNYFNSTHFVWVDLGCSHIVYNGLVDNINRILLNPRPKITMMYIHYRSNFELMDMEKMCNNGICGIATTIFSAEATYINRLYSHMWSIFYEKLARRIGHTDETVFTYCYDRHPELFNLYYGDYYSTATNYHNVRNDYHSVKYHFIENALRANRRDLATVAAKNVLDSLDKGLIILPDSERTYLTNIASL